MKRALSFILVFLCCVSMLSTAVFAAEESAADILAAVESAVQESEETAGEEPSSVVEPAENKEEADVPEAATSEVRAEVLNAGVAASGTCGDELSWNLSEDGVLTISGTGEMTNFTSSSQPWKDYRDSILQVKIEEGVSTIGDYAFYFCQKIGSVALPESVISLGKYAFGYCSDMEIFDMSDEVYYIGSYAFAYCSKLTAIVIPESVTSIRSYTFRECKALASVTLSEWLRSIGEFAFGHCDALETLVIPETVNSIGENAFYSCDGLKQIEYKGTEEQWYAIDISGGNSFLWAACPYDIPSSGTCGEGVIWSVQNGVLTISGTGAMTGYKDSIDAPWYDLGETIEEVEILEGVTYVGAYTLENSSTLKAIRISEGVQTIGSNAFRNCYEVVDVILPESVTELEANAFRACECTITVLNRECVIGNNSLGSGIIKGYYGSTAWVFALENYREFLPLDENVPVNERVFPDEQFRSFVNSELAGGDGVLSLAERSAVTELDCSRRSIASLKGIEFFPNLKVLDCSENALSEIDLSENTSIEKLGCGDNALSVLNVQKCAGLTEIDCTNCQLAVLDVSGCPVLTNLACEENGFSALNLRKNPSLKALVEENEPTVINGVSVYAADGMTLTMDAEVTIESGAEGQLLAIDEVNFPDSAFRAYIRGDITDYETGESLFTGDANMDGYLSHEELAAVKEIDVSGVYWDDGTCHSLEGIEYFAELELLNCGYQSLTELDLTGNPKLRELIAYKSGLLTVDLTGCQELEVFKCYHTGISELDLSGNPKLKELNASEINLTALDVTGCPELEILHCGGNWISELDLSQNPNLVELRCYNTMSYNDFAGLTELDVSACAKLEYLDVSMNSLTELDVSNNPALKTLIAYTNAISKLDISKNAELTCLECNNNLLEELDISRTPALLDAYINGEKMQEMIYDTGETYSIYCIGDYDSRAGKILVLDDHVAVLTEKKTDPGDVTDDGYIRTDDLVILMKYIAGADAELVAGTGDVNGDEKIDILDVVRLVNILATD